MTDRLINVVLWLLFTNENYTRRMAIANGTCVSFCNRPKAHFGLPWIHPWYNRGKCHMDSRGLNACQTHRSMYPSIFNRFPVIQPVSSKVRYFSTFLHILAFPGYAPVTIAVNVTCMERGFNAIETHRSIYPSIINRLPYSEILVGNCNFFLHPYI